MLANIGQGSGDDALYRETAAFVDCHPKPGIQEVAVFLRERAKADTITLVIGQFLVAALFERRHGDLLYWSMIAAEVNSVGIEQWPEHVREALASQLQRGIGKVVSRNLPH